MLDGFTRVWSLSNSDTYHAEEFCKAFEETKRKSPRKPRRSRLAAVLAAQKQACRWCAKHLQLPEHEVQKILASSLSVLPRPVVAA